MKITRRQLRRIIKEETSRLNERGTGNPALAAEERALTTAVVKWVEKYRMVMGMAPHDSSDDRRIRRTLDDIIGAIIR